VSVQDGQTLESFLCVQILGFIRESQLFLSFLFLRVRFFVDDTDLAFEYEVPVPVMLPLLKYFMFLFVAANFEELDQHAHHSLGESIELIGVELCILQHLEHVLLGLFISPVILVVVHIVEATISELG
jgi:hypothetical protein